MSGICGIVGGSNSADNNNNIIKAMMASLAHRGPDGEGIAQTTDFCFGHRRLAVIDLDTGDQPMWSSDGRYCLVYNGSIYNYMDLRQQLSRSGVRFKTFSDTEVLLNMLIKHGEGALEQCNGMFAFALFDTIEKSLLLARDRSGIKPLYYTALPDGGICFASEIKALFRHPQIDANVSDEGMNQYMVFQFCLNGQTMFKNIEKLPPAHTLLIRPEHTPKLSRWWSTPAELDLYHTNEYFEDQLLMLLHDAVKLQLRSDVPIGSYLSGGLDSSTVTMLATQNIGEEFDCFTGRFMDAPGYDESHYAKLVTEASGAKLHLIEPTAQDFVDWMPQIIRALDEPVAGPGVFPQFMVSQLAKQHVTVCLGGQGADEIFGGYARYLVAYLEQALKGAIFETQVPDKRFVLTLESVIPNLTVLKEYVPMLRSFWQNGLFEPLENRYFKLLDRSPDLMRLLTPGRREQLNMDHLFEQFKEIFASTNLPSSINRMLHFDQHTLLPALLQIEDRASMHSSLESRTPLLDHRIIELAASMPPTFKLKDGRLKYVLRQVVKNILPAEVTGRKDKMGFPVPLKEWMKKGPVKEFVQDILLDSKAKTRGIFDPVAINSLVNAEHVNNRQIWGVLCLELWHREFLDKH